MPGIGIVLFILLLLVLAGGVVLLRLGRRRGFVRSPVPLFAAMAAALALYLGGLVVVSLGSPERLVAVGDTLRFCGFYLDCHLGISVVGAEQRAEPADCLVATLRLSSDARQATLRFPESALVIVDRAGRRFPRDREAERRLGLEAADLDFELPSGASRVVRVAFRVPHDAEDPRLLVRTVHGPGRVVEALLIGDDDSFLHPRPQLALR